jgi:chromatin segregation and condensation protein Rec8/ScpA/Scc1 (kleisin family)
MGLLSNSNAAHVRVARDRPTESLMHAKEYMLRRQKRKVTDERTSRRQTVLMWRERNRVIHRQLDVQTIVKFECFLRQRTFSVMITVLAYIELLSKLLQ